MSVETGAKALLQNCGGVLARASSHISRRTTKWPHFFHVMMLLKHMFARVPTVRDVDVI